MSLLLSDIYPLRTASALGNFSADVLLPEVFGDLSDSPSPLVRLTDTEFLAADHPARVANVQVDGQDVQGWYASTATDPSGRAWCKVTLAAPADPGMALTAGIIGKASPSTGAIISHPADIMGYILGVAGKSWDWSNLKAELPGIALAGRINQSRSVRAWLDEISRSCGVVWSASGACAYPTLPGISLAGLDRYNTDIEDCTATATDAADRLTSVDPVDPVTISPEIISVGLSEEEFVPGGIDYLYIFAPSETTPRLLSLTQYIDGGVTWSISPPGVPGKIAAQI